MDITELRKLVENATYLEPSSWGLFPDSLRLYGDKLLLLASLLDEHEAVVEALRMLHDEQNGPPLVQREAEWEEAMKMTRAALALSEGAAACPVHLPTPKGTSSKERTGGDVTHYEDRDMTYYEQRREIGRRADEKRRKKLANREHPCSGRTSPVEKYLTGGPCEREGKELVEGKWYCWQHKPKPRPTPSPGTAEVTIYA